MSKYVGKSFTAIFNKQYIKRLDQADDDFSSHVELEI